ncbi:MAG: PepSY domain-containing protein [Goleter apudmare HA4340-LM2]|jgi:uncharacterized membrane protein YkoI|nr:PepSY domain-containing protein [Goleter apudmare HA4340-LM2]
MITQDQAIEIAKQEIQGKVEPQQDAPIKVELKDNRYIVVFEHINPPGTRGPDYDAKVTIDGNSGKVLEILGGS